MTDFFVLMQSLERLEDAEKFANEKLEGFMAEFLKARPEERAKCAKALRSLKNRLHPLQNSPEAQDLLQKHANATCNEDRKELQQKYVRLSHQLMESEQGLLYAQVTGHFDRHLAPILAKDHGAGRSNRARRAKAASSVFTANAGLSNSDEKESGDKRDRYGNMIGSHWDLGRDGAYDGLKVLMLHEWDESGQFKGDLPVRALQEKGFHVVHRFGRVKSELLDVDELRSELNNASQVWLISGSFPILTGEHLQVIVEHWKEGLGVYIFGDNSPFYVDANRLLERMHPDLLHMTGGNCPTLQLRGNIPGGRAVRARSSANSAGAGFVPNHLLVTGIVELYEGVTVSTMVKGAAMALGFEEVLREHTGELVVVARESTNGCGPIIVDGAFTKLFCHWDEGGSSRFVRNCACWLSTIVEEDEIPALPQGEEEEPPELDLEGAFAVECSITNETGPAALLASQLADMEQNTTDFSLDNNLALARRNMVLGTQPLTLDVAKLFLQQGENPFTRKPVEAVLPIVALSNKDNLKLVTEIANKLFMGGRAMNRHSLNILLSVCEEMLHRQPDHEELLKFFIRELLRNAVSTPDMLKGIPGGPTVPLEEGLRNNITVTGEFVPLRKAFPHVSRIVRLLAQHASEPRLPVGTLRQVARRSLLKTLIGATARYGKLESMAQTNGMGDDSSKAGDRLKQELDRLLFDQKLGIPIEGSAKLVGLSDFGGIVKKILEHTNMDEIVEDTERVKAALENQDSPIVSDEELTAVLVLLRSRTSSLWSILIEPLLAELKKESVLFSKIWDEKNAPGRGSGDEANAVDEDSVCKMANHQLTGSFQKESIDHASIPWPGFVSPLGPSVYRCKCGFAFGDPRKELTPEAADELRQHRNQHFQAAYGADSNGYPTTTSAHFPLHRAVQRVLTRDEHKSALERSNQMEWDVARYLTRKQKGNIHVGTIQSDIRFAIDTYLACRNEGMAEPGAEEPVDFLKKAKVEQELILAATGDKEAIRWVDPVRT